MNDYYYLDATFTIESNSNEKPVVDVYKLKEIITSCIKSLFGEAGAANQIDILKYQEKSGNIILRCFADFYVKLRASLSFGYQFDNIIYSFHINKASASLLSLQSNSKLYKF